MKKVLDWVRNNWSYLFIACVSVLTLFILGFYNLSSITDAKLSAPELVSIQSADSGQKIVNNPIQAPFKIAQYAVIKAFDSSVFMLRGVSVIFGIIFILLFYSLLQRWFSPKIAYISTVMVASSSFFLSYTRLAVPDIMLPLSLLVMLWTAWWLHDHRVPSWTLVIVSIAAASVLYVPGIIWIIILASLAQFSKIKKMISRVPRSILVLSIMLILMVLLPLIRAFYYDQSLLITWLALPKNFVITDFIKNLIFVPASLTVRSLPDPVFNLGRLPLLDIATLVFSVLGVYAYGSHIKLVRTRVLAGAIVITWIMIALNNSVSIVMLLPLVYITAAGGIMLLLQQWYSVFPNNPVARNLGVVMLSGVIAISIIYNINRYFVAWANNPVSQAAFQQNPTNLLQ